MPRRGFGCVVVETAFFLVETKRRVLREQKFEKAPTNLPRPTKLVVVRVGSQVFVRKFRIPKFRTGRVADCPGLARVRPNDTTARLKADIPGIQVNKRQLTKPPTELYSIFPSVIADIVMQYCQQFIPFAHDEDIRSCYSSTPAWKVEFQPQW